MIRTYITAGPTLDAFHVSDEFVRSVIGPVGSGKSSACCAEIIRRAMAVQGQEENLEVQVVSDQAVADRRLQREAPEGLREPVMPRSHRRRP